VRSVRIGRNEIQTVISWRRFHVAHLKIDKLNFYQKSGGVTFPTLKGRRKGTTAVLKKIADVLKVPLDLIV
jgi:hypothetical protein